MQPLEISIKDRLQKQCPNLLMNYFEVVEMIIDDQASIEEFVGRREFILDFAQSSIIRLDIKTKEISDELIEFNKFLIDLVDGVYYGRNHLK